MQVGEYTHTTLSAPGVSDILNHDEVQPASGEIEVTAVSIDTNAIVRVDLSDDNFSSSVHGDETTITGDGTYSLNMPIGHKSVRPRFVSESGGTAAVIGFKSKLYY